MKKAYWLGILAVYMAFALPRLTLTGAGLFFLGLLALLFDAVDWLFPDWVWRYYTAIWQGSYDPDENFRGAQKIYRIVLLICGILLFIGALFV